VGHQDPVALLWLVLVPHVVVLAVGAYFTVAALAAMRRVRECFRRKVEKTFFIGEKFNNTPKKNIFFKYCEYIKIEKNIKIN
jgi:hypothetical protein